MTKTLITSIIFCLVLLPLAGQSIVIPEDDGRPHDDYADLHDNLISEPVDQIQITKAVYNKSKKRLRVWAVTSANEEAELTVVKYDKLMRYKSEKGKYVFNKKKLNAKNAPKYVKVVSSLGGKDRVKVKRIEGKKQ